ncbi:hypothetical protein LXA43DRAFT_367727 [Ganoderma leucocontextum]|nr:hypothetical protein LXA43DRAFT_367727 [Ganoderma leucocontextum]
MKLQSMLRNIGWNSLAGILVLLLFPAVTEADPGLPLNPNPASSCETLTVQWPPTAAQFYCVAIVDQSDGQILFQTNITGPTTSVEWPVIATNGASLHFAIHTPPHLSSQPYEAMDFHVHSGSTPCPTSDPPISTAPATSTLTTSPTQFPLPSTSASSAASPSATVTVALQTSTAATTLISSTTPTTVGASTTSSTSDSSFPTPPTTNPTTSPPSVVPLTTSLAASSAGQSRLTTDAVAGIAVGMGAVVICLALASFSYIKRRGRSRTLTARADPFAGPYRAFVLSQFCVRG